MTRISLNRLSLNRSLHALPLFALAAIALPAHAQTVTLNIGSDTADAGVRASAVAGTTVDGGGAVIDQGAGTLRAGGPIGSGFAPDPYPYDNAVFVFQLPAAGSVSGPFTAANFTAYDAGADNTFAAVGTDLYGLGVRSTSAVQGGDFFLGASGTDTTDATLIEQNFKPATGGTTTPAGTAFSTDTTGQAALLAYLNAQYAGGANAGQFVFLRLNTSGTDVFFKFNNFNSADNGTPSLVPTLSVTGLAPVAAAPEPSAWASLMLGTLGVGALSLRARRRVSVCS